MTTKQLYNDVLCMGFDRRCTDGEADFEKVFESAVNRAQETLAALFPLYCERVLYLYEKESCLSVASYHLRPYRIREFECEGARAYSFTARGRGTVTVYRDGVTHARHTINSPLYETRFTGEWEKESRVTVRMQTDADSLTLHDLFVHGEKETVLQRQGKEIVCPLDALTEGALSLDTPPKNAEGRELSEGKDYRVENGNLYLGAHVEGQLKLTITRAPRRFDAASDAPDVRKEAEGLLPLLVASYVWLDDDREKALFYLSMYRESLSRVRLNWRNAGVGHGYGTVNGW